MHCPGIDPDPYDEIYNSDQFIKDSNYLYFVKQRWCLKGCLGIILVGLTLRQGYTTSIKYLSSPISIQMQELPIQGIANIKELNICHKFKF